MRVLERRKKKGVSWVFGFSFHFTSLLRAVLGASSSNSSPPPLEPLLTNSALASGGRKLERRRKEACSLELESSRTKSTASGKRAERRRGGETHGNGYSFLSFLLFKLLQIQTANTAARIPPKIPPTIPPMAPPERPPEEEEDDEPAVLLTTVPLLEVDLAAEAEKEEAVLVKEEDERMEVTKEEEEVAAVEDETTAAEEDVGVAEEEEVEVEVVEEEEADVVEEVELEDMLRLLREEDEEEDIARE